MRNYRSSFCSVALLLTLGVCQGVQAQSARQITLSEALAAAAQNIESKIAKEQVSGARADVLAANHAPLPTLSTAISQIDLQNGVGAGSWLGDKRVDKSFGIDWTWERGGKRQLRTEAAKQNVTASEQDLREAITQQKLAAQAAFFDLLAAQERIEQIAAIADSAKALAAAAAKRLAAGDLSAQDAARSNIEALRAQNDAVAAEQDRVRAELALNLVLDLGRIKLTAVRSSSTSQSASNTAVNRPPSMTALESRVAQRPDVQSATAKVEAAKLLLNNALALRSNDVTLGAAIDHWPGTSNRLLMLRMQMPLQLSSFGGYSFQGEIDRASAQLAIAEAQLDRTKLAASNEELRLGQELTSSEQRAKSYAEGIAPAAKRVADQAELAYSKGALSLTDLLDARRTRRATALEAIAAQADFDKAQTAYSIRQDSLK